MKWTKETRKKKKNGTEFSHEAKQKAAGPRDDGRGSRDVALHGVTWRDGSDSSTHNKEMEEWNMRLK